jgi:hypothetical protein
MDRRVFIGSFALGTLAVPRTTRAQPARKVYRIGILGLSPATSAMRAAMKSATLPVSVESALRESSRQAG